MEQKDTSQSAMALSDIKVLELGSLIAGPYASALLAQFGAEVIKIESPLTGDPLRKWRKLHDDTSLWWYTQSRNKKSVTLDLRAPEGQEIVRQLVREADIVIENFRPGTLEKWGIGWEQLSTINPSLIMVRISGYGQDGPASKRPGFAAIAECMGGLRYVTGYPDRAPVRAGISLGDTLASLYGVIGALMALHHLNTGKGKGQFIDVALYEAVFAVMESLIPEYSLFGHVRERTGAALPGIVPSNTYVCRDNHYIIIAGNGDSIFQRLMQALGRDDLANDPALVQNDGRALHANMLDDVIQNWCLQHSLDDALAILEAAEVPCGRIYTAEDIVNDPHYQARDMIQHFKLPDGNTIALPGIVPKLSATPGRTNWLGPKLGEHTSQILESIGITEDQLQQLRDSGLV